MFLCSDRAFFFIMTDILIHDASEPIDTDTEIDADEMDGEIEPEIETYGDDDNDTMIGDEVKEEKEIEPTEEEIPDEIKTVSVVTASMSITTTKSKKSSPNPKLPVIKKTSSSSSSSTTTTTTSKSKTTTTTTSKSSTETTISDEKRLSIPMIKNKTEHKSPANTKQTKVIPRTTTAPASTDGTKIVRPTGEKKTVTGATSARSAPITAASTARSKTPTRLNAPTQLGNSLVSRCVMCRDGMSCHVMFQFLFQFLFSDDVMV